MTDRPTRRDLMKPAQLVGLAFVAALFGGIVTLVSMGAFQARPADEIQRAIMVALVVAGVTFIVTLVVMALLVLAVDPAQIEKKIDRAVLLPPEETTDSSESASNGDETPERQ
ncbi:F0F1-type ATP synthase membrane subunit c/vacuolar-type H+-ATPase subunit K [Microbacterium halimionae]|uniref:F0F1-type ATP synthase membrane subunit c/vacuolar-type H+-ATPase subunit K n=1 Tax=Microbacterium halimionae TaxID=1526413 RepID=A0A7W3JQ71_9MICO|nr:amino acid transporter [Microbacterium halimionae]MBA8817007.1 F0F1-type ATP synthase membrane subunit c/vacuolar-type H+-ATPase subunit K [Microbacterium halimionae]NII94454.1 F0F1-type ATP synthase membrane subunit c/vacuolar-type H+-ATPase subunit K [Microbacterium halimionae]